MSQLGKVARAFSVFHPALPKPVPNDTQALTAIDQAAEEWIEGSFADFLPRPSIFLPVG
jgi:hypothetical protein